MPTRRNLLTSAGMSLAVLPFSNLSSLAAPTSAPSAHSLPLSFTKSLSATVAAAYRATKAKTATSSQLSTLAGKLDDLHMLMRDNGMITQLSPKWNPRTADFSQSTREALIAKAQTIVPELDPSEIMQIDMDSYRSRMPATVDAAMSLVPALGNAKLVASGIAGVSFSITPRLLRIQEGGGGDSCNWSELAAITAALASLIALEAALTASYQLGLAAAIYGIIAAEYGMLAAFYVGC